MSIRIENLTKTYGEQKAVNDASFRIGKGEVVGFLGPNGAGKSTTMKIITGYIKADAGRAFVGDTDVTDDPMAVKRKIGYLPESNALYHDMFVREYLSFIAGVHKIKNRKDSVEKVIALVGLTRESKKKIGQLSKGYKQRVGLAAALVHDPEVLILDEPTSGLDPNQIVEIREVIRKQGENKTVLFSSHILQEVEAICDRVIIIHRGNIVADDRLSKLQQGLADSSVVNVQFDREVDQGLLKQVKGVNKVERASGNKLIVHCTDADMVRKQILTLALQHNLNIVSLQSEKRSLEEIFKELTRE